MQPWIFWLFGGLIGAALGSFISATLGRIKSGISLAQPSRCDGCGKLIRPWQNIPILTWLILRGRGACCGGKIGISVLIWEAGMTVVGILVGALGGMTGMIIFPIVVIPATLVVWLLGTRKLKN
jgi:leader peptidase (prepilin peptidase)/N-methyltransferase